MPDRNSLAFWKDFAAAYKNHPAVVFDLYNEPHDVSWDAWLNGGPVTEKNRRANTELSFEAVGMQALLDAVRGTGAKNLVIAGGLDWLPSGDRDSNATHLISGDLAATDVANGIAMPATIVKNGGHPIQLSQLKVLTAYYDLAQAENRVTITKI